MHVASICQISLIDKLYCILRFEDSRQPLLIKFKSTKQVTKYRFPITPSTRSVVQPLPRPPPPGCNLILPIRKRKQKLQIKTNRSVSFDLNVTENVTSAESTRFLWVMGEGELVF